MSPPGPGDPGVGHSTTPVSTDDLVRVVTRALSERTRRIHLTAGQRRAILHAPLRPPGLLELEELLSDYLDTRVSVTMGTGRGKLVVEFATLEDLERIYRLVTEAPERA